jgi:hypothetical protein
MVDKIIPGPTKSRRDGLNGGATHCLKEHARGRITMRKNCDGSGHINNGLLLNACMRFTFGAVSAGGHVGDKRRHVADGARIRKMRAVANKVIRLDTRWMNGLRR